jgi:branched-chain amino acid transport system permease protein
LILKYAPEGIWDFVDRRLPRVRRKIDWGDAPVLAHKPKPVAGELVLDVQSVRKEFGGLVAVNDISFQVRAGEIVGLIGPNGAGKSTTFNLVTGVLALTGGTVNFRGEPIAGLPSRAIARKGMVRTFQHVKMIPDMTVLENVALGAHTRGHKGVLAAMARLDGHEEKMLFKEAQRQLERIGMGEMLHDTAGNLPMGMQRLLEIARALCADPALLLLDEPAAGLRLKEKQGLVQVLRQLQGEGISILLVEHDMDLVMEVCDRLVVMEFGTQLMEGTPREVQQSPAVRAAYLGTEH